MTDIQVSAPRPLPEPLDDSQSGTPARRPRLGPPHLVDRHDVAGRLRHGAPARRTRTRPRDDGRRRGRGRRRSRAARHHQRRPIHRSHRGGARASRHRGARRHPGRHATSAARSTTRSLASAKPRRRCTSCSTTSPAPASSPASSGCATARSSAGRNDRPEFGVRKGRIICSGLRPGGSAQMAVAEGRHDLHGLRLAGPIAVDDDPLAWHEFPERPLVSMRRHRRVDVRARRRRARDRLVLPRQLLGARRHRDGVARVHRVGPRRRRVAHARRRVGAAARAAVPRVPVGAGARGAPARSARACRSVPTCRRRSPSCRPARTSTTCCAASPRCPRSPAAIT